MRQWESAVALKKNRLLTICAFNMSASDKVAQLVLLKWISLFRQMLITHITVLFYVTLYFLHDKVVWPSCKMTRKNSAVHSLPTISVCSVPDPPNSVFYETLITMILRFFIQHLASGTLLSQLKIHSYQTVFLTSAQLPPSQYLGSF